MSKFSENFKKNLTTYIVTTIIAFLVGVAVFLLYFFLTYKDLYSAVNASFITSAVLLGGGLLIWVSEQGTFDSLVYGFKQMFTFTFNKKANKLNDYGAYKQEKNAKRADAPKIFLCFIAASLIFIIALIVLEIAYHINY